MKLYLLRHGHALFNDDDSKRPLSFPGQKGIETLAKLMETLNLEIAQIYHSPKVRAVQTANIIAAAVMPNIINMQVDLNPESPIDPMLSLIGASNQSTMLVGHLPYLAHLAHKLTGAQMNFHPGSCLCLEGARDIWQIEWFIKPEFF